MRFTKLGSTQTVCVDIKRYRIQWDVDSISNLQTTVKKFFKPYWFHCVVLEEFRIPGSRLRCDFLNLNKRIAIEVHGDQHFAFNSFFHDKSRINYLFHIKRDVQKYKWLEANGFRVIELTTDDIPHLSVNYLQEKFNLGII